MLITQTGNCTLTALPGRQTNGRCQCVSRQC